MTESRRKRVYVPGRYREGAEHPEWPARAELAAVVFTRPLTSSEACAELAKLFHIRASDDDRARQLLANVEAFGLVRWDVAGQTWNRCVGPARPAAEVTQAPQRANGWDGYTSPSRGMIFADGHWLPPPEQITLPSATGKGSPWRREFHQRTTGPHGP